MDSGQEVCWGGIVPSVWPGTAKGDTGSFSASGGFPLARIFCGSPDLGAIGVRSAPVPPHRSPFNPLCPPLAWGFPL